MAPTAPDSALANLVSTLPRRSAGLRSGAEPQRLGLTAQRGGAERRPVRQALDRVGQRRDQRVAHVFARQIGADRNALGHEGRHVLGRVHGAVDRPGEERGVDFLGEQALAPSVGERPILDRVPSGSDDLKRDPLDRPAMRLGQPAARLVRLRERQWRTARAEREDSG